MLARLSVKRVMKKKKIKPLGLFMGGPRLDGAMGGEGIRQWEKECRTCLHFSCLRHSGGKSGRCVFICGMDKGCINSGKLSSLYCIRLSMATWVYEELLTCRDKGCSRTGGSRIGAVGFLACTICVVVL